MDWLRGGGLVPDADGFCAGVRELVPRAVEAVVVVRPSDAATDDEPIPGTDGSIRLPPPPDDRRAVVPEVRVTSAVGGVRPAAPAGPWLGPACERLGSRLAGE
jgi:hypothetical protein